MDLDITFFISSLVNYLAFLVNCNVLVRGHIIFLNFVDICNYMYMYSY